jgi:AcrR family transcriptional regulator
LVTEVRPGTRAQIVRATGELMAERGVIAATTRAIAERAGCSEGSIYRHFPDKHALFHAVVLDRFEPHIRFIDAFPGRAGQGDVRENLEALATESLAFYRGIAPVIAAHLSDGELREGQRAHWEREGGGPMRAIRAATEHLERERRLGRIDRLASPEVAARLVLGSCFAQVILVELVGDAGIMADEEGRLVDDERYAADLVAAIWKGIAPRRVVRARP